MADTTADTRVSFSLGRLGRTIRPALLPALAVLIAAGCAMDVPLGSSGPFRSAQDVDAERLRARLDRDGDGGFDEPLDIARFTFNHAHDVQPFIEAAGVSALHSRLSLDTGSNVVIPAGHPVDSFLAVLTSEKAMAAHGLLVIEDAADAAGLPEVGDVLARAGRDQTVEGGVAVMLDGSDSLSLVEGVPLTYRWSQTLGEPVDLSDGNSAVATYLAPSVSSDREMVFKLTVSAAGATDSDTVAVSVTGAGDDEEAAGDATAGEAAYAAAGCAACHGADASGTSAPDLRGAGQLPGLEQRLGGGAIHLGATLTDQEIADVAAWLATLE